MSPGVHLVVLLDSVLFLPAGLHEMNLIVFIVKMQ